MYLNIYMSRTHTHTHILLVSQKHEGNNYLRIGHDRRNLFPTVHIYQYDQQQGLT